MVRDLAAALNETRGYLGLPPIDAQQLIDKAYAEAGQAGPAGPAGVPVEVPISVRPTHEIKPENNFEVKTEPVKPVSDVTPDGSYTAFVVDRDKNGEPCFDPAKFGSKGIFKITISGGKATFAVKSPLSDQERDDWDVLGAADVCDGDYQPMLNDAPVTDKPGEAEFRDGKWVVTAPAELS